ncbi:hypothetical protein GBAR_LOCUS25592 [Geodia barretti]|uniref:Uncharacterized protein n=1 Tax=Geodia barretti TaxID=519541 RepID=A0AA35TE46_GEOBA|nr:hypothetical protein GBAR_LOCUS25592 [Geodia barretti]
MALGSPTQDVTTLVVKVQYPSICAVYESDLDSLLDDLNTDISGYTCTLQAVCKDKSTQTRTRSVVNYVTGGPDAVAPYCKTYSGGNKINTVLMELLTSDRSISPRVVSTVQSRVKDHIGSKTDQPLMILDPIVVYVS